MEEDRMLSDEILLGIINAKSGGGGGGGTDDYNDLKNQPKIEGVTLKGNKTAADLGLATAAALADKVDKVQGKSLSTNDFTDAYKTAIGDNTTALALKQNATDNNLDTEDKTIVGAINENAGDIGQLKSGLTDLHFTRIEENLPVTTTETSTEIGNIAAYSALLFVAKFNSTVRGSLYIPKVLFDSGVDCYVLATVGNIYVKYVDTTHIKIMGMVETLNYMSIYGIK